MPEQWVRFSQNFPDAGLYLVCDGDRNIEVIEAVLFCGVVSWGSSILFTHYIKIEIPPFPQ